MVVFSAPDVATASISTRWPFVPLNVKQSTSPMPLTLPVFTSAETIAPPSRSVPFVYGPAVTFIIEIEYVPVLSLR